MSRFANRVNGLTTQDLVIDLVELSEEDLKQISGSGDTITAKGGTTTVHPNGTVTNTGGTVTVIRSSFVNLSVNNDFLSGSDFLSASDFDRGLLLLE